MIEIKVPSPGESITEVEIGNWLVEDGSFVEKGQEIAEVESDKATLTLIAEEGGKITFKVEEGQAIAVGEVACTIDTSVAPVEKKEKEKIEKDGAEAKTADKHKGVSQGSTAEGEPENDVEKVKVTSVAKEMMKEAGLTVDDIISGLKRLGKKEVEAVVFSSEAKQRSGIGESKPASREVNRQRMSMLRRKLSQRLVTVKNETAMLTTFNEVDMSHIMDLRKKYQRQFIEKHGFKLGFMSFFTKAVAIAAQSYPTVISMIDGDEIVTPGYVDVGIAVSTPKGLMVPNVRNAEGKSIPEIEMEIKELAGKARNKKISVEELSGGTFTITNGGVFGSLLSTPIINPPQSAILGMHAIVERPVAVGGQVVIRPMMYIALSYDHRIIDGKDSVGFLVKVKQLLENPGQMITNGKDFGELLLGI